MNEAETRAELIDPALKAAGWGIIEGSRIRREVITLGRLVGNSKRAQSDIADYVLVYRGEKLATIEAKKRYLPDTAGLGQAKKYAEKLQTRFAYSTNGIGLYQVDTYGSLIFRVGRQIVDQGAYKSRLGSSLTSKFFAVGD